MRTELLKQLGLTDAQINAVMRENGKDIASAKEKFSDYEKLKTRIAVLEKYGDSQKLSQMEAQTRHWQEKAEKTEKEWKKRWEEENLSRALQDSLQRAGARNPKAVKALLNLGGVSLQDGKLCGLEEQIKQIRQNEPYLFGPQEAAPAVIRPGNGFLSKTQDSYVRQVMGLPLSTQRKDETQWQIPLQNLKNIPTN